MKKKLLFLLLFVMMLPGMSLADVIISEIMTSNGTYEGGHA